MSFVPLLTATGAGGGLVSFLPFLLIIVVFYLVLIRPQQKRAREQRNLISAVEVGDDVVMAGGLHGTVRRIEDTTVDLEVAPGTVVTMERQSVIKRKFVLDDDVDDDE